MQEIAKTYECAFIIHPDIEDNEVNKISQNMQTALTKGGATILNSSVIGRQRLAYSISGQRYGSYVVVDFQLVPNHLPKLNHALRLVPNILRFLIVEKITINPQEQERLLKAKERLAARSRDQSVTSVPRKRPVAKHKLELKDLDKKLDEILTTENI